MSEMPESLDPNMLTLHPNCAAIGLDLGSTKAKYVQVGADGSILNKIVVPSHRWEELLQDLDIQRTGTTGYFRKRVGSPIAITEITAARTAVIRSYPEAEVIVDIGGQDTKILDIRTNRFELNDKCSAGTGAFLEFAASFLGVGVEELGAYHAKARHPVQINNTCSVFALSEMISLLVDGASKADLIAGMHDCFARRIRNKIPDAKHIVMVGGPVLNTGLQASFETLLSNKPIIPDEPQFINAQGAALHMLEQLMK